MIVNEERKDDILVSERLDALISSFPEIDLECEIINQEKLNSTTHLTPITAWNWSKSF